MVLRLIPVTKLVACGNHLGTMRNQNLFPPSIKYAIALPGSSDRMTKGDRHPNPLQVLDRVMTCHDLLGLQISKLASLVKKKKRVGHAVHGIEHIVVCSIIFEKAEAVQEYMRKEDK